jgi:hypothetical protein
MTSFRPFFNPATGEWITYSAVAEDSDGQFVRFSWRAAPGGVIPEHVHPRQQEQFTILAGEAHFTADGKTTPAGVPKNPLQLGATVWHFRRESRVTTPPIWVQNLVLPPLWALAKVFGVRPYHRHWDSRI